MRKFQVNYHDNSGPKSEVFEGYQPSFDDRWFKIERDFPGNKATSHITYVGLVIAIPTEMIYSVEELDETS